MEHRKEYSLKLLGRNLRRLRMVKGYTVDEIREYLCLGSSQAVYKYENGGRFPKADSLLALMELYEADAADLTAPFPGGAAAVSGAGTSRFAKSRLNLYQSLCGCFRRS